MYLMRGISSVMLEQQDDGSQAGRAKGNFIWLQAGKAYPVLRVFYGSWMCEALPSSTFVREDVIL